MSFLLELAIRATVCLFVCRLQNYRMQKQKTYSVTLNDVYSPDDEHRANGNNNVAISDAGKTSTPASPPSLRVFCSDVSIVGLRYVANPSASLLRRSLWILLLVAGAAFTTFQIQHQIRRYFSWPVNVDITEDYQEEMTFPTVTICNENRVSKSKASSMGKRVIERFLNRVCLVTEMRTKC